MSAHEIDDVTRPCLSTLKFVESTYSPVRAFIGFMIYISLLIVSRTGYHRKLFIGHFHAFNLHRHHHQHPTIPLFEPCLYVILSSSHHKFTRYYDNTAYSWPF